MNHFLQSFYKQLRQVEMVIVKQLRGEIVFKTCAAADLQALHSRYQAEPGVATWSPHVEGCWSSVAAASPMVFFDEKQLLVPKCLRTLILDVEYRTERLLASQQGWLDFISQCQALLCQINYWQTMALTKLTTDQALSLLNQLECAVTAELQRLASIQHKPWLAAAWQRYLALQYQAVFNDKIATLTRYLDSESYTEQGLLDRLSMLDNNLARVSHHVDIRSINVILQTFYNLIDPILKQHELWQTLTKLIQQISITEYEKNNLQMAIQFWQRYPNSCPPELKVLFEKVNLVLHQSIINQLNKELEHIADKVLQQHKAKLMCEFDLYIGMTETTPEIDAAIDQYVKRNYLKYLQTGRQLIAQADIEQILTVVAPKYLSVSLHTNSYNQRSYFMFNDDEFLKSQFTHPELNLSSSVNLIGIGATYDAKLVFTILRQFANATIRQFMMAIYHGQKILISFLFDKINKYSVSEYEVYLEQFDLEFKSPSTRCSSNNVIATPNKVTAYSCKAILCPLLQSVAEDKVA